MSVKVYVKAIPGRIARESPRGPFIPHDRYVPVPLTNYIMRLATHHGDIELLREKPKAPRKPAAQVEKEIEQESVKEKVDGN